ncbi:hypothetical protein AYO40_02525 [Planctomycetaceae bacterium SCGC AG-212-D15]|nr:hypothetical protein AYO40_02525 [Planctomycetaceae bacterium SCGC AG-212-D15]
MPWPLSQDYNEAIQNPASSFADPELRQGEAATNALGIPMPRSGNFADVYEVTTPRGKWAVKCFTRQIPGLRERYREISAYLKQTPLPFMVDFTYLEQGIRVRGDWYPVLKMQWVEGFTLNQFVKDNVEKPTILDIIGQIWVKLAARLREAKMAHCDLQHGNVLLVPGSKAGSLAVKLVDYDGMCVPALTMLRSIEMGHPNFQHPQRAKDGIYSLEVDRFSHLVIFTAVRALQSGGRALWDRYDNGDNLLFKASDFQKPGQSPLFKELLDFLEPNVRLLAEQMTQALARPLAETPQLDELSRSLPPWKPGARATMEIKAAVPLEKPVERSEQAAREAEASALSALLTPTLSPPAIAVETERAADNAQVRSRKRPKRRRDRSVALVPAAVIAAILVMTLGAGATFLLLRNRSKPESSAPVAPEPPPRVGPIETRNPPPNVAANPDPMPPVAAPAEPPVVAATPPAEPSAEAETIDLLKLIDPQKHAVAGAWRTEGDVLVSPPGPIVRLQVPYAPPDDYELEIDAARTVATSEGFFVGLVTGGSQVCVGFDGWDGTLTALHTVDGKFGNANETTRRGPFSRGTKQFTLTCTVSKRQNRVTVACDGRNIIDWQGDFNRLALQNIFLVPDPKKLFIGTNNSVMRFSRIALRPMSAPPAEAASEKVYLCDMPEIDPIVAWGQFGKKGALGYATTEVGLPNTDGRIVVGRKNYPNGLSMHPGIRPATVKYRLGKTAKALIGSVAFNDSAGPRIGGGQVLFTVLGDAKPLWQSRPMRGTGPIQDFRVDVGGVDLLELRVAGAGHLGVAHTVWLDPYVLPQGPDVDSKPTVTPPGWGTKNPPPSGPGMSEPMWAEKDKAFEPKKYQDPLFWRYPGRTDRSPGTPTPGQNGAWAGGTKVEGWADSKGRPAKTGMPGYWTYDGPRARNTARFTPLAK